MKNNFWNFISIIATNIIAVVCIFLATFSEPDSTIMKLCIYIGVYSILTFFVLVKEKDNIINIKTINIGLYTLMIGISPLVYYYHRKTFIFNGNDITYQFYQIIIGYLFLIIGMYFLDFKKRKMSKTDKKSNDIINKELTTAKYYGLILLFISTLANLYIISLNKNIYFGGNLVKDVMNLYSGKGIIVYMSSLYLIGIGLLYNYYINTKTSKKTLLFFIIVNIIFFIIRGSRTQVIMIFIYLIIIRNYYKSYNVKALFRYFIVFLIIIGYLGVIRDSMSSVNSNLNDSIANNLLVNSINIEYINNTFPKKVDFQYGKSLLINIKMLMPGPDDDFTLWLKKKVGLSYSGGGLTPTLIGEGYLNFGVFGITIFCFIVGYITRILNKAYYSSTKSGITWIAYIIVRLMDVYRGGLSNIQVAIIIIAFVYLGYLSFNRLLIKKNYIKEIND